MAALRAFAAVLLLASICAAEAKAYPTALAALESNKNLTLFTKLAEASGLKPFLKSPLTKATIFAPTDAAILALAKVLKRTPASLLTPESSLLVDRVIGQHIVLGSSLKAASVTDGAKLKTAGHGTLKVVVTKAARKLLAASWRALLQAKAGGKVVVVGPQNNATVVGTDLIGGNVTIHVIDAVLLPSNVFPTLAAALASSPTVSVLASFIAKDPKLAAAAADPTTNITLLAPVNKALEAVAATPAGKALIANAAKLHNVLAYHAIKPATIVPTFKGKGTENFETLAGVPVTVTKVISKKGNTTTGVVTITGKAGGKAVIRKHNIIAGASYVNVIDGVLLP
ncbi:hypothetical protein MNEG_3141 [Monoraphidium neglectum]|uniref:FAS1 domain-containing protein n=1 Tax=Monoraphidium neglectum TaxID=145388 RepID=A0A0D2MWI2_9CHLO|nr:hypothetical protein MNEG_3141 [Monoraphidium neglectum]KIZ04817.1 hypothetical protein MNEG_3141 [Monoraphidium neglectum]|eukprot:XP_013903836.1 hypothetical protein MNEG_3141 [Monoraphidium neglectum]